MKFLITLVLFLSASISFAQTCTKCRAYDRKNQAICDSTIHFGKGERACAYQASFCFFEKRSLTYADHCVAHDRKLQGICNSTYSFISPQTSPERACMYQAAFCSYVAPVCN